MNYQYKDRIRGDYKSSAHDWRARKQKVARRFKLEDFKFDDYHDPSVFFVIG